MDINELLGKATKAIGKIKGVSNGSTGDLITKAKSVVANTKPIKKKEVTIDAPDLTGEDTINEGIGKKIAQVGAGHVANIGKAEMPESAAKDIEAEFLDKKYPDVDDEAENDDDVDNFIMALSTMIPQEKMNNGVMGLVRGLLNKLGAKKFTPEQVAKSIGSLKFEEQKAAE